MAQKKNKEFREYVKMKKYSRQASYQQIETYSG